MVRESGSQQDSLSIRSNEIQDELLELRGGLRGKGDGKGEGLQEKIS